MTNWTRFSLNTQMNDGMCFGCGQKNPIGLKLGFKWDGKAAQAEFTPTELYQGWPGIVHGGIIICLLDEAMTYAAMFDGSRSVTAKMQIRLKRAASLNEPLLISSSVTRKTRKLVETQAIVSLKDSTLIAEGTATHFVANSQDSRKIKNDAP